MLAGVQACSVDLYCATLRRLFGRQVNTVRVQKLDQNYFRDNRVKYESILVILWSV